MAAIRLAMTPFGPRTVTTPIVAPPGVAPPALTPPVEAQRDARLAALVAGIAPSHCLGFRLQTSWRCGQVSFSPSGCFVWVSVIHGGWGVQWVPRCMDGVCNTADCVSRAAAWLVESHLCLGGPEGPRGLLHDRGLHAGPHMQMQYSI